MQGLWPGRRWRGYDGVRSAIQNCRIIRIDPLDVVGQAHDLALLSRVTGYERHDLDRLMYEERAAFEHGGSISIFPREQLRLYWSWVKNEGLPLRWERWYTKNTAVVKRVTREIAGRGPLGTGELIGGKKVDDYRSSKLEGLALYYLWRHFDVMIHHRENNRKFYDLTERMFGALPDPLSRDATRSEMALETMSRLGMSGQEGLRHLRTSEDGRGRSSLSKRQLRQRLVDDGRLTEVEVEGERQPAVLRTDALKLLEAVVADEVPRQWRPIDSDVEAVFMAPIDVTIANGRSKVLFDFEYLWEVYKPAGKRRWGYYVLPVLCGDRIIGRIEPAFGKEDGRLSIIRAWWEQGTDLSEVAMPFARGIMRLARFLDARSVVIKDVGPPKFQSAVKRGISSLEK